MAEDVRKNTVCLLLKTSKMRDHSVVRNVARFVEGFDIDPEMVSMSKKLIDCDELSAVGQLMNHFCEWVGRISVPSFLKRGMYLVPTTRVEEVQEKIAALQTDVERAVEAFIDVYPMRFEEAKVRLKSEFDVTQYIVPDTGNPGWQNHIRRAFTVTYQWVVFDTPTALREVSDALFQAEKARAEEQWRVISQQIEQMLIQKTLAQVEGFQTRLKAIGTGVRGGRLQQRTLEGITQFLDDMLSGRNVTGNEELEECVRQARDLLHGIPARDLRSSEALRTLVDQGFDTIRSGLQALVSSENGAHARAIRFSLDESMPVAAEA